MTLREREIQILEIERGFTRFERGYIFVARQIRQ
jgi:hypothetical protein